MALNINGRMKVKTLRADFLEEFGLTLRIYDGRSFADEDATLASIRKGDSKGGEFAPKRNTKIGNLEDKIMDLFGIKTQVSGSDDSYLCNNDLTLSGALEEDNNIIGKRERKSTLSEETADESESTITDNRDGSVGFGKAVENILEDLQNAEEDEDSLIITFLYNEKEYEYNAELDEYQNAEYLTNLLNNWMEADEIEQAMDDDMETEYNIPIDNIKDINISIE